ncbi:hypothetical protein AURDEDRAFT_166195 [Auricularia subglabra TFB-10046 SS5]|nr:hypothetical protein AURDEDRAFT_166195 [Auricularia subglabra TFB-10046 SS5]
MKKEAAVPLHSPLFKFDGTIEQADLDTLLAKQACCDVSALSNLTWRFPSAKKGDGISLEGEDAFEHFQDALCAAKPDKIVEFWIDPPVRTQAAAHWTAALATTPGASGAAAPTVHGSTASTVSTARAAPSLHAPAAPSHPALMNTAGPPPAVNAIVPTHWALAASGPVHDQPALATGTGTFDEQLAAEVHALQSMYPPNQCPCHPGSHCYTHPRSQMCFDLANPMRAKNWAVNNLKGTSTRQFPPIGSQFFEARNVVKNKPAAPSTQAFAHGPYGFATPPPAAAHGGPYGAPYGNPFLPYRYAQPPYTPPPAYGTPLLADPVPARHRLPQLSPTPMLPLSSVGKEIWKEAGFKPMEWHAMLGS